MFRDIMRYYDNTNVWIQNMSPNEFVFFILAENEDQKSTWSQCRSSIVAKKELIAKLKLS